MPVKTVSWRQQSELLYKRPTTSPQMSPNPPILLDQTMNLMQSLSLTAKGLSLLTAQTARRQHPMKRKVRPANTLRPPLQPLQPSSVFILIAPLLPTENHRTKKTTTVTRKRRAKRTTWSPRLPGLVIPSLIQTLVGITAPHYLKAQELQRSAPPQPVMWTVLRTMVRQMKSILGFMSVRVCVYMSVFDAIIIRWAASLL